MRALKRWSGPLVALLAIAALAAGCNGDGEEADTLPSELGEGWSLIPISIEEDGETVRVEFAARNDTNDWGAMRPPDEEQPAVSLTAGGNTYRCEDAQIGTGGRYLPPGFQIRGYLDRQGEVQAIYVECQAPEGSLEGATLTVPYILAVGEYDYYEKGENIHKAQLKVALNPEQIPPDLTYPVASEEVEVEVHPLDETIIALNECPLELVDATRTDEGFTFEWTIYNPGEYNTLVHIGNPAPVGKDGIVYNFWISPDRVEVPMAKPDETTEIVTEAPVPPDVETPYLLLSVEQKRERLWTNYLLDLSEVE